MHITLYIGQVHIQAYMYICIYVLNMKNTVIATVTDSYRSQFNSQLTVSELQKLMKLSLICSDYTRYFTVHFFSKLLFLCFMLFDYSGDPLHCLVCATIVKSFCGSCNSNTAASSCIECDLPGLTD